MKIVLRHKSTGRYYNGPGHWVRRADNALVFDDLVSAREFSRANHLDQAQPVQRLAPYMMALLQQPVRPIWDVCRRGEGAAWYAAKAGRFSVN